MIEILLVCLGASLATNVVLYVQYESWKDSARLFRKAWLDSVGSENKSNNII